MDPIPEITPATDQPMTQDEKQFFRQLGSRVAALRKEQGLTQVQLAQALELTQQMVASYEIGRRRIPVSLLPPLARALGTSVEELIGDEGSSTRRRGPAPQIQQKIERLTRLPKAQQKLVLQMLDGVLAQAAR
jgi:transcriptional regulator with XRE-family HTH domain